LEAEWPHEKRRVTVWKLSGLVRRTVGVLNMAVILKPTRVSEEQITESVVWVE
jgi:hypothetical protein